MDIALETSCSRKHVAVMEPEHDHDEDSGRRRRFLPAWFDEDIIASTLLDTLKNLRFDSGSRPPMAEPGKWAFGGNAPQRGGNTR